MSTDYTYEPETASQALVKTGGDSKRELQIVRETQALEPVSLRDATFSKSGTKPLLVKQAKILRAPLDDESEADILPTGEVYMSHVYVRRRLNDAVGPMGWALRPVSAPDTKSAPNTMYREFALIVLGRVVATAFGSQKYYADSKRMDFADTAEAVKSNALTRCCKDLGIGSECWDRRWCETWKEKYAVHVWVTEERWDREARKNVRENVARWRRLDARPFPREFDIVRDSPNQAAWRKQWDAWIALLKQEAERSRETVKAIKLARADVHEARQQRRDEPKREQPQKPATQHQASNGVAKEDRPFLIRDMKIIDRAPNHTLHKIVMMDGTEYLTFDTRFYAELGKVFAARKKVHIKPRMAQVKGRNVAHVDDYRVEGEARDVTHKRDDHDQRREREVGEEG